ncbi:MAG: dihydroneopterin aldolase [Elusimicrobiota bacterium]
MDVLGVRGLEVWLKVGCTPEERAFAQKIILRVALELPLRDAGRKDDAAETVDYAELARRLKGALEPRTFRLMEAVAEAAAEESLRDARVRAATVRVDKRALAGIESAWVEIRRERA